MTALRVSHFRVVRKVSVVASPAFKVVEVFLNRRVLLDCSILFLELARLSARSVPYPVSEPSVRLDCWLYSNGLGLWSFGASFDEGVQGLFMRDSNPSSKPIILTPFVFAVRIASS